MSLLCENMSKGESRVETGWGLHPKVDDDNIALGVVGTVEDVRK